MLNSVQQPSPEHLEALFESACGAQTAGRLEEAREKYRLLLVYLPNVGPFHYNLGLVLYDLDNFSEALGEFSLALSCGSDDADTLFNLALCQVATGSYRDAIVTYEQVLQLSPDGVDCLYNLAGCYRRLGEDESAIAFYIKALTVDSTYLPALNNLAYLYHRGGHFTRALHYYRQLLCLRPEDECAGFMVDSLSGKVPDSAPDMYVREFFNNYAGDFEKSLVGELGYDNPRKLYKCFRKHMGQETGFSHGLDLGCGTGLSGLAFKEAVTVLDGVDLSGNMLEIAAEKNLYASLHEKSIAEYLALTTEKYDFFLATDVFIYVGALESLFLAAKACGLPGALFCFSTEYFDSGNYTLRQTGRFAYSREYIHTIAASTGWKVIAREGTSLRRERDGWIEGDLWLLQQQPPR